MLDIRGRIGGYLDVVDLLERRDERAAAERVVGQEERSVEVEQRKQRGQIPSRSSIAASRRHFGRVLT